MFKRALVLFVFGCSLTAQAADNLQQSKNVITKTNQTLKSSQQLINKVDVQTTSMFDKHKGLQSEIETFLVYNRQLSEIVSSQDQEKATFERSIKGIEVTSQKIMPFMERMINSLDTFVSSDYPFLLEERHARIDSLKANMKRADISVAAKYRQILESFQIEIDYGNTIESYDGEIDAKKVSFLKLGRVGLYYMTFDKSAFGAWNIKQSKWQALEDSDFKISIANAIKMAKKQKSPDLFFAAIQTAEDRK
jgi:hypothetical protein